MVDEAELLQHGQVGPVLALLGIAVVGVQEVGEDLALVLRVVRGREVEVRIPRLRAVGGADDAVVGGVVARVRGEAVAVVGFVVLGVEVGHCGRWSAPGWRWF